MFFPLEPRLVFDTVFAKDAAQYHDYPTPSDRNEQPLNVGDSLAADDLAIKQLSSNAFFSTIRA